MKIQNYLIFLKSKNIHVWLEVDKLRIKAPASVDIAFLKQELQLYKNQLKEFLKTNSIDFIPVHYYVEAYAEITPDAIAIVFNEQQLTYRELNEKANQLAHYLREKGVGADYLVGLYIERSCTMIIGILGILKAGGAYLPIDPQYPEERLEFLIKDAKINLILSQQSLQNKTALLATPTLLLDTDWQKIALHSDATLTQTILPDSIAYVIYTSGSTGQPKGVEITHRNVSRLMETTRDYFAFNSKDIWSLFHAYNFDFSVWEIWGALAHGGQLVIIPYTIVRSPEDFLATLVSKKITILNQTPSAFQQLIAAEEQLKASLKLSLRFIIFGGEALKLENLKPWFERHGDVSPQLVNMYGITETTVHVTYRPIKISDLTLTATSIIGVPIPDLTIYLLDESLHLVPEGVPGEIYVGGPGVARGYLNQPALTAERFIPDPWSKISGARLYRSGDLARYFASGELEYLRRADKQVKIRGFRIELQEIESAIQKHPAVSNAIVTTFERESMDFELVSYVLLKSPIDGLVLELRTFLKSILPDYMIPAAFVQINHVPLTQNGKIDYAALPKVQQTPDVKIINSVKPNTPIEKTLVDLWSQLLRVENIGITDNFFELGGDSILAIQLVSRARQQGINFSPKQLFERQTIAELAEVATTESSHQEEQQAVTGNAPLTPIQQWFFEEQFVEPQHWNQAVLLKTTMQLDSALIEQAVQLLVQHHDALRHHFVATKNSYEQSCSLPEKNRTFYKYADLTSLESIFQLSHRDRLIKEAQSGFNLAEGPMFQVVFFKLQTPHADYILFVAHHLVIDAVSWRILLEDFATLYHQLHKNETTQLPPKTTSFIAWARRLNQYAVSEEIQQEIFYWMNIPLDNNIVQIPHDYPGNKNLEADSENIVVSLTEDETQQLLAQSSANKVAIQDMLLLTLSQTFPFITKQDKNILRIDIERHGRESLFNDIDVSRTVGWFTAIFPLLLHWDNTLSWEKSLIAIKDQLQQIPHQGIGYGLLRYLQIDSDICQKLRAFPKAQIIFNYLGYLTSDSADLFELETESVEPLRSPHAHRPYEIEITAAIVNQCLQITWHYSKAQYRVTTIQKYAQNFVSILSHHLVNPSKNTVDLLASKQPKTETEKLVTELFSQLTGISEVSKQDDFFALGGQVTLVVQFIARIRKLLGISISFHEIFSRRTMEKIAEYIDQNLNNKITEKTQELISFTEIFERYPLKKLPLLPHYQVSPCQLPELFFNAFAPDSPMYNILSCDILLIGDLNLDAVRQSFETIEARHPIFRTYFGTVDGELVQMVRPARTIKNEDIYIDLTHIAEEDYLKESTRLAHLYGETVLNFKEGPLFNIKFAGFPGKRNLLLCLTNHVAWDEVSMINFATEFRQLYNSYNAGESITSSNITIDYFDYTHWINQLVSSGILNYHKRYWLDRFADQPLPIELPTDFPRPAMQTFNGSDVSGKLPRRAVSKLFQKLAESKREITLSNFLLSLLTLLLYRLTGQSDIIIGMPFSNRMDLQLEKIMGPFAVALPIRLTLSANMTFAELLAQTQEVTIEALEHSLYPGILAIQEINPDWDMSRARLYPVMYGLQHNKSELWTNLKLDGLETARAEHLQAIGPLHSSARCDLRVLLDHLFDDLFFSFSYNSDLFLRSSVERMANQFILLFEQVLENLHLPLKDYNMLSVIEKNHILSMINDTGNKEILFKPIHIHFEQHAARHPESIAIHYEELEWSYAELNNRANQLAHHLLELSIKPEMVIAICMHKSPEMIVAMLAILKVGAAFLPLDAALPLERVMTVLEEAGVTILLTHNKVTHDFQTRAKFLTILTVDHTELANHHLFSLNNPALPIFPEQLAYIIYTSGSTGTPKGVMIPHLGIENRILAAAQVHPITQEDISLQFSSASFDVSILEIFLALCNGAQLVIPTTATSMHLAALVDLIRQKNVTIINFTPSLLQILLQEPLLSTCHSLRFIHSGGETMPSNLPSQFLARLPRAQLYNFYGPTEASVDVLFYPCHADSPYRFMPIGRPFSNMKAYVLNEYLELQPIGVPGELYLSGVGLARGYYQRSDLTAESFVPNKYACKPGERLYKTGDRVRMLSDGNIEFMGRIDRQVKIRGNRVELDEVEAKVLSYSAVKLCTVRYLEKQNNTSESTLLSYIELQEKINTFSIKDKVYYAFSLAQKPELNKTVDNLHRNAWPEYFMGDDVMREYWPYLYEKFSQYQIAFLNENNEVVGIANSVPIYWDGTSEQLPAGWDGGLSAACHMAAEKAPNTLLLLAAVVKNNHAGLGLSAGMLEAMKDIATTHGLTHLIAPVRPTGKCDYPELDFTAYCALKREDGLAVDNWLRTHERLGAKILKVDLTSQRVEATIEEWQTWTGEQITRSGSYISGDVLQPVMVDLEQNSVVYNDPCIWVEHPIDSHKIPSYQHIDGKTLREYLGEFLPQYMVPQHYLFLSKIPLTANGKINVDALPHFTANQIVHRKVVPPETKIQSDLVEIWQKILEQKEIGISDNFFALGGHSIRAMLLVSKIQASFGVTIRLKDLFIEPTIYALEKKILTQLSACEMTIQ